MAEDLILNIGDMTWVARAAANGRAYLRAERIIKGRKIKYPIFAEEWNALRNTTTLIPECMKSEIFHETNTLEWELVKNRSLVVRKTSDGQAEFDLKDSWQGRSITMDEKLWEEVVNSFPHLQSMLDQVNEREKNRQASKRKNLNLIEGEDEKKRDEKTILYRFYLTDSSGNQVYLDSNYYKSKEICLTRGTVFMQTDCKSAKTVRLLTYTVQRCDPYTFMKYLLLRVGENNRTVDYLSSSFHELYNDILGFGPCYYGQIIANAALSYLPMENLKEELINLDDLADFMDTCPLLKKT